MDVAVGTGYAVAFREEGEATLQRRGIQIAGAAEACAIDRRVV